MSQRGRPVSVLRAAVTDATLGGSRGALGQRTFASRRVEAASPRPWSRRLWSVGRACVLLRGWPAVLSPRPHRAEGTRMPFMGAPHSPPDHLPKAPPPNAFPGVRVQHRNWGGTRTQMAARAWSAGPSARRLSEGPCPRWPSAVSWGSRACRLPETCPQQRALASAGILDARPRKRLPVASPECVPSGCRRSLS